MVSSAAISYNKVLVDQASSINTPRPIPRQYLLFENNIANLSGSHDYVYVFITRDNS